MLRQQAEDKCKVLEEEEIDILKRIKTTTQVHKAVVEDLQKMNITSTDNFKQNSISKKTSDKTNCNSNSNKSEGSSKK